MYQYTVKSTVHSKAITILDSNRYNRIVSIESAIITFYNFVRLISTTNSVCSNNIQNFHSRFSHQWRPGLCAGLVLTISRRGFSGSVSTPNTPSKSLAQTRLSTRSISSVFILQSRKPRFCCGRFQSRFQILHWLLPSQCRSVRVGISTSDPHSLRKTWTAMGRIDNRDASHFYT